MKSKKNKIESLAFDVNSPFIRNYIWVKGMPMLYEKIFNIPSPFMLTVGSKNDLEYYGDLETWKISHKVAKGLLEKDFHYYKKIIDQTVEYGESFNKWSEENLYKKDFSKYSNQKISKLYELFIEKQAHLYALGTFLPLLDFGDFSFVESNLNLVLKKYTKTEKEFNNAFACFTEPTFESFIRLQEKDLLNLVNKHSNPLWKNDLQKLSFVDFFDKYKKTFNDVKKHLDQFAWVYFVYQGPALSLKDIFIMLKEIAYSKKAPKKRLEEFKQQKASTLLKQKAFLKKNKLNDFEKYILELAGLVVWAKPARKDFQSKSYWHLESLLKEIARRLSLSLRQVRCIDPENLLALLKKKKVNTKKLLEVFNLHVCIPLTNQKVKILSGKKAEIFLQTLPKKESEDVIKTNELKGATAFSGIKQGVVKIVNKPEEMNKVFEGDILVSIATTPSLVPAMKKAGAIITDEGGLTCHASIVSREMRIPCVVGTKIATKVLKDGDLVEVDAEKGVVKIIKRV